MKISELLDQSPPAGLRAVAALMRERALAATPGDPDRAGGWDPFVMGSEGYAVMGAKRDGRLSRTFVARCGMNDWDTDKANAEHIASWHPDVALAVADWLDRDADGWDVLVDHGFPLTDDSFALTLAVARAYVRNAPWLG